MGEAGISVRAKKENWVDAVKGIAMCSVLMIHSGANSLPGIAGKIGEAGVYGVQIFYVISACLVLASLERYHQGKPGITIQGGGYLQWWIRRLLRLVPLYYTALILYRIFLREGDPYWLGSRGSVSAVNMIAHILLLHGLAPHYINSVLGIEWYLGNLALFYFMAPFLYRKINSAEKSVCFFLLTTLGSGLVNHAAFALIPEVDAYIYEAYISSLWIVTQLPVMAGGICLYHILRRTDNLRTWGNRKILSWCILAFSVCMIWGETDGRNQLFGVSGYALFAVWSVGIMLSQVLHPLPLICNALFRKIGQNSYGIYLFHWLIIKLYSEHMAFRTGNPYGDWGIRFVFVLLVSYGMSVMAERLIGRPVILWTEKWKRE